MIPFFTMQQRLRAEYRGYVVAVSESRYIEDVTKSRGREHGRGATGQQFFTGLRPGASAAVKELFKNLIEKAEATASTLSAPQATDEPLCHEEFVGTHNAGCDAQEVG
jgi:hypothetical protein